MKCERVPFTSPDAGFPELTRVLVAGAGGFIGSHLAKFLHRKGYHVRVADIHYNGYQTEPYSSEKLTLDLRTWRNCLEATKGTDEVYNLAANMGGIKFITDVAAEVMRDNTLINTHLLEASRTNKVKRFFFSSSACVYPTYRQKTPKLSALQEADAYPADPDSFYGWEKLAAEKMCEAYQRDFGMKVKIARYHNIYGPKGVYKGGREKSPAALCRKVAEATNPGTIKIWGDGRQTRSYCYIDDAVKASFLLMKSDYQRPINIGSDRLVSIDELADIIIGCSGKMIQKVHEPNAPQGVRGRNADISVARKLLGWEPEVSLEKGLSSTYEWIAAMCAGDQVAVPVMRQIQ